MQFVEIYFSFSAALMAEKIYFISLSTIVLADSQAFVEAFPVRAKSVDNSAKDPKDLWAFRIIIHRHNDEC